MIFSGDPSIKMEQKLCVYRLVHLLILYWFKVMHYCNYQIQTQIQLFWLKLFKQKYNKLILIIWKRLSKWKMLIYYLLKGQNKLLATYRCQANTQEIIMRIGIKNEMIDSSGKICIYITPLLQPKCCQILRYRIPPLFWHTLIEEHDER